MNLLRTYTPMACPELGPARTTGQVTAYELGSDRTLAIPHAPNYEVAPIPAAVIRKCLNAIANLETARKRGLDDKNLSQIGRAAKLEPIQEAAAATIEAAKVELADFVAQVDLWETKTYAPPSLASTDAVGGLVDMEIRTWARATTGKALDEALKSLVTEPRLVEAVIRSPIPLGQFSDLATQQWRERIAATSPDAAKIVLTRESIAWAAGLLPYFAIAAQC